MVTTVHYIVTTLYSLSQPLLTLKTNSFQSPVPTSPAITHHTPSQQPAVSHSCAECTLTSVGNKAPETQLPSFLCVTLGREGP